MYCPKCNTYMLEISKSEDGQWYVGCTKCKHGYDSLHPTKQKAIENFEKE